MLDMCMFRHDFPLFLHNLLLTLTPNSFFLRFMYLFLERGEGRENERERNINVREISIASHMPPPGDLACNPGVCPDQESNR